MLLSKGWAPLFVHFARHTFRTLCSAHLRRFTRLRNLSFVSHIPCRTFLEQYIPYIPYPTFRTLHSVRYIPNSTLRTLQSVHHTSKTTFPTINPKLYVPHTKFIALHFVHDVSYNIYCIRLTTFRMLHSEHYFQYTTFCALQLVDHMSSVTCIVFLFPYVAFTTQNSVQ